MRDINLILKDVKHNQEKWNQPMFLETNEYELLKEYSKKNNTPPFEISGLDEWFIFYKDGNKTKIYKIEPLIYTK
jgi:hypothetical protein